MVEDETGHLTWDIYGVPLSDVVFETEKTLRAAVRCVAFGNLIAITHTNEASEARQMIIREAGRSMDFYWNRDMQWPFSRHPMPSIPYRSRGFRPDLSELIHYPAERRMLPVLDLDPVPRSAGAIRSVLVGRCPQLFLRGVLPGFSFPFRAHNKLHSELPKNG